MKINSLNIWIKDYKFALVNKCEIHKKSRPVVVFSFGLRGDFHLACQSDDVINTIDYHQLSIVIKNSINKQKSCQKSAELNYLPSFIKNYSPLISDGYIEITIKCKSTFYQHYSLLV